MGTRSRHRSAPVPASTSLPWGLVLRGFAGRLGLKAGQPLIKAAGHACDGYLLVAFLLAAGGAYHIPRGTKIFADVPLWARRRGRHVECPGGREAEPHRD